MRLCQGTINGRSVSVNLRYWRINCIVPLYPFELKSNEETVLMDDPSYAPMLLSESWRKELFYLWVLSRFILFSAQCLPIMNPPPPPSCRHFHKLINQIVLYSHHLCNQNKKPPKHFLGYPRYKDVIIICYYLIMDSRHFVREQSGNNSWSRKEAGLAANYLCQA